MLILFFIFANFSIQNTIAKPQLIQKNTPALKTKSKPQKTKASTEIATKTIDTANGLKVEIITANSINGFNWSMDQFKVSETETIDIEGKDKTKTIKSKKINLVGTVLSKKTKFWSAPLKLDS